MEDWYPDGVYDPGHSTGTYSDNGEPKGLLHTTEGKTYAGARVAFVRDNSWPHSTATYEHGFFQIYNHTPISVPSRSLRNLKGGVETNRDRVVQLEIVGSCDEANKGWGSLYSPNFPKAYLDGIAKWMRWVEAQLGVPRRCTVTFKGYPASAGANNGVRLSNAAFDYYSGWLGHQHAAEQVHGDPGLIDINYLLGQPTKQEPDEMPTTVLVSTIDPKLGVQSLTPGSFHFGRARIPGPADLAHTLANNSFTGGAFLATAEILKWDVDRVLAYRDVTEPLVVAAAVPITQEQIKSIAEQVAALSSLGKAGVDELVKALGTALSNG
jgi:hypothetical protein